MKIKLQNLQDAAKTVLGGKLTALNIYVRKEESYKSNNLSFHFRKLETKLNSTYAEEKKQ